ncbi:retrovirus-related pol polyprotein from transposon TNT 1-94 [Tanacetum coccineum]
MLRNRLSEDFGKHFIPQQELSDEQAFQLQTSHPNTNQSASSPVKIEAPRELPKVILVNTSLKRLKYHLSQFDNVVKKRITPDALTEGEWGASYSACKYVKLIQELLGYVRDTCPNIHKPSEKLVAVTPINKKKTIMFTDVKPSLSSRHPKTVRGTHSSKSKYAQDPLVAKVYTRRPKVPKTNGSNSKPKIAKSVVSNKTEPDTSRGSKHMTRDRSQLTNFVHKFLASKDEAPDFIIKFLKMIQVRLNRPVRNMRTDNGTKLVNQTLRSYYESVGISHETSVAQSPQQNGVVERQNLTFVKAARTILIYAKAPLFLWAEVVATVCYTQNRSIILHRYGKPPYELLHDRKPDLSYLHVFGALCNPNNDSEDLGKLQAKADIVPVANAPRTVDLADSPVSTSIDQDALSTSAVDPTLFTWKVGNDLLLVQTYVDDIIFASTNTAMCTDPRGIFLNQSKYASEIIKKYGMLTSDSVDTPMVEKDKQDKDLQRTPVDVTLYRGMIGSLMYQAKAIDKQYLMRCKRIFRYLNGTHLHLSLRYSKDTGMSSEDSICRCHIRNLVVRTLDAKHVRRVRCLDTRRSTSGSAQFLGDKLVSWSSKKQKSIAISSTKAKYISLSRCCAQILWMRLQLTNYGFQFNKIPLYCDNKSALALCCNNIKIQFLDRKARYEKHVSGNAKTSYRGRERVKVVTRDHAGAGFCQDTRRSTSGSAQFSGDKLVSWSSKKQKSTAISSTEAEYIIPLYSNNKSVIALRCNNVQLSRAKHIDVRYHFIKEQVENGIVDLYFVRTEYQLADIFTKPLPRERFNFLIEKHGMRSMSSETLNVSDRGRDDGKVVLAGCNEVSSRSSNAFNKHAKVALYYFDSQLGLLSYRQVFQKDTQLTYNGNIFSGLGLLLTMQRLVITLITTRASLFS